MILRTLSLHQFRIFESLKIELNEGINLFTGKNGQGKTSILEAVNYLSITKSFRTNQDKNAISFNAPYFEIKAKFSMEGKQEKQIRVYFSGQEGKHIFINENKVNRFSEYFGTVPGIVLTPDDLKLTLGAPGVRRRFMDILLSQVNPLYLNELKNYRRALQQKNRLLAQPDVKRIKNQITIWNEQLVNSGTIIIQRRLEFIRFLNEALPAGYSDLSRKTNSIEAFYKSTVDKELNTFDGATIKSKFNEKLDQATPQEIERRTALIGPHRDDLDFLKDNKSFKEYGSQGENKTLVVTLKLLEWDYLSKKRKTNALLLMDDIFGELDSHRIDALLEVLYHRGQVLVATALEDKFTSSMPVQRFLVNNGNVAHA